MSTTVPTNSFPPQSVDRVIYERLKLYFAVLTGLGGLALFLSSETETTPILAVFFAIFGYIFVDWLKLFSLPPIIAYAAMAVTAVYCTSDIILPLKGGDAMPEAGGNMAMTAVAQLLVQVQAILMLQKKNRRIFEQLGVFCLLDLVVAAVFGNAIGFGVLLIPLCLTAALALSLLAVVSASEGLSNLDALSGDTTPPKAKREQASAKTINVTSADGARSLAAAAPRLPLLAILSVGPSVLLLAGVFFYLLPRTTTAARESSNGKALVGFNEQVNLKQIGQMQQNPAIALRAKITDSKTGKPYKLVGELYLRGRVLERYEVLPTRRGVNSANWSSIPMGRLANGQTLPPEVIPTLSSESNFYDVTDFDITCSEMRSRSLFAPAPYHRTGFNPKAAHLADRWTLVRKSDATLKQYPRIHYKFASHAFKDGLQTELLARFAVGDSVLQPASTIRLTQNAPLTESQIEEYELTLLEYDIDSIPSAATLSKRFTTTSDNKPATSYNIAKSLERYLAISPDFSYTLNLNARSIPGLDPIEQFLSVDKRGHCQYYSAALVMMLRSQGIPSRIVVGYKTDEYNDLAQQYVARQMHAHAWVEALIDRDQIDPARNVYGQTKSEQYWLRLDPTPTSSRSTNRTSRVTQVLDVAQNAWDDYVVDMDRSRQQSSLIGGGITPMTSSYDQFVSWLSTTMRAIRNGTLLSQNGKSTNMFSWPAAVVGFILTLFAVLLFRVPLPKWLRQRIQTKRERSIMRPSVEFYARVLDQLVRLGIKRDASQTPIEVLAEFNARPSDPATAQQADFIDKKLRFLTTQFYVNRFGGESIRSHSRRSNLDSVTEIVDASATRDSIDQALRDLTKNIDELIHQSSRSKS
ncbi:DUF3488 and transglutaminase-like domain-containing protein [bacterium]|nr:DUF3488 and transglutaminase-like domain-containing protein [bacterium]